MSDDQLTIEPILWPSWKNALLVQINKMFFYMTKLSPSSFTKDIDKSEWQHSLIPGTIHLIHEGKWCYLTGQPQGKGAMLHKHHLFCTLLLSNTSQQKERESVCVWGMLTDIKWLVYLSLFLFGCPNRNFTLFVGWCVDHSRRYIVAKDSYFSRATTPWSPAEMVDIAYIP